MKKNNNLDNLTEEELELKIHKEYEPWPCILCTDGYVCSQCGEEMELIGRHFVCHHCKVYAFTVG